MYIDLERTFCGVGHGGFYIEKFANAYTIVIAVELQKSMKLSSKK